MVVHNNIMNENVSVRVRRQWKVACGVLRKELHTDGEARCMVEAKCACVSSDFRAQ